MVRLHETLQLSTSTKQTYISLPFVAALAWENSWYFVMPVLVSLRNYALWTTERLQNSRLTTFTTQIWVVLLIGWSKFPPVARPIRSTTQIWAVIRHACLFLTRQFAKKPDQWWNFEMSAVFLDYLHCVLFFCCRIWSMTTSVSVQLDLPVVTVRWTLMTANQVRVRTMERV